MGSKTVLVTPEMINLNDNLLSTFGQFEIELAAVCVVAFCQLMDGWAHFTKEQVGRIFNQFTSPVAIEFEVCFEYLLEDNYIYQVGDYFMVTSEFVRRCYDKHPAKSSFAV